MTPKINEKIQTQNSAKPLHHHQNPLEERTLKIEESGDFHRGVTVPNIRLKGKWLKQAGFPPGRRVEIRVNHPGVMTIRLLNDQGAEMPALLAADSLVEPFKFLEAPQEYKVTGLRECPTPEKMQPCDTPDQATAYWNLNVATHSHFDRERECLAVLLLNTRRRIKGHYIVSIGTQDALVVHPREIFRVAIMTAASEIILMHNHPSGESTPSETDIKVTRDLIRVGQILKMELLDHVIIGNGNFTSLRSLGYLFN